MNDTQQGPSKPADSINRLLRPNIRDLKPYSSARHEFEGQANIWLDANENPFPSGYNRYPDPLQAALKDKLAALKGVSADHLFLGNGSDEAIDLLIRLFCRPGLDHIIQLPPTYGMYRVSAAIADVQVREAPLTDTCQPDPEAIRAITDAHSKILFVCSPNNPTGNLMDKQRMRQILRSFPGIVVVDEAYIDFAGQASLTRWLKEFPHLVILQTFSKAWALAAARLGIALANPEIIGYLNKVKPPYNVNALSQEAALKALENPEKMKAQVQILRDERQRLAGALAALPFVQEVLPSDANFILAKIPAAKALYDHLLRQGIVVRDRSTVFPDTGALRFTVGQPGENNTLISALQTFRTP